MAYRWGKKHNFILFLLGSAFVQAGKRLRPLFLAKPLPAGLAQVGRAQLAQDVLSGGTAAPTATLPMFSSPVRL